MPSLVLGPREVLGGRWLGEKPGRPSGNLVGRQLGSWKEAGEEGLGHPPDPCGPKPGSGRDLRPGGGPWKVLPTSWHRPGPWFLEGGALRNILECVH